MMKNSLLPDRFGILLFLRLAGFFPVVFAPAVLGQAAGVVVVNVLPVEETMSLQINGATLGNMAAGTATGPLPIQPGPNTIRLVWGQTNKAEGIIRVKPGETALAVAHEKTIKIPSPADKPNTGGVAETPFQILSLNSGEKVKRPQFHIFSAMLQKTNLQVDGKVSTIEPGVEARIGSYDRIRVQSGDDVLVELDGTAPACLDGPMQWFLFLFQKTKSGKAELLPVAGLQYQW